MGKAQMNNWQLLRMYGSVRSHDRYRNHPAIARHSGTGAGAVTGRARV